MASRVSKTSMLYIIYIVCWYYAFFVVWPCFLGWMSVAWVLCIYGWVRGCTVNIYIGSSNCILYINYLNRGGCIYYLSVRARMREGGIFLCATGYVYLLVAWHFENEYVMHASLHGFHVYIWFTVLCRA